MTPTSAFSLHSNFENQFLKQFSLQLKVILRQSGKKYFRFKLTIKVPAISWAFFVCLLGDKR
jgi:hypothetical protein